MVFLSKKLELQAGGLSAGERGKVCALSSYGILEGTRGLTVHSETAVSILLGKAVFLPPKGLERGCFCPLKLL